MVLVLYQSRAVRVEHSQAGEHCLVLLHVLFEGKMRHQSRHNLLESELHIVSFPLVKTCCRQ